MQYICSFYTKRSPSIFYIGKFGVYFLSSSDSLTSPELCLRFYWYILYVCAYYNGVCSYIFVHMITVSVFLCLCMLHNLIAVYTSIWYFVLYVSCAWFVLRLHHCYVWVGINMFVNVISMVTVICFCTL